jgi:hypothetical protein
MKKNLLALLAVIITGNAMSQVGLEGIIVEKYYIADAADSTDAADNFATSPLRVGAITYRVYADLLPGYKLIQQFGNANHPMEISTTTTFYNDPNYGFATYQGTSVNNTRKNTTLIDSYLTVGGVANGLLGVLKTDDTDGSIGNTDGLIANTDPAMGLAVTGAGAADGLMPGVPVIPNTLGLTTELDVFDQIPGSSFVTTGGTIAALGGALGATDNNHVLLGQFTTDGTFSFRLNLQVATLIEGESQIFVADTPINNEIVDSTLTYVSEPPIIDNVTNVVAVKNEFKIFPNPASEMLNVINLSGENVPVNYTVLDMTGRSVMHSQFWTGVHAFDVSQLPAGAYVIRLEKQGRISNLRFIKG